MKAKAVSVKLCGKDSWVIPGWSSHKLGIAQYFAAIRALISEQLDSETANEWAEILLDGAEATTPNVRYNAVLALGKLAAVAEDDLVQNKVWLPSFEFHHFKPKRAY